MVKAGCGTFLYTGEGKRDIWGNFMCGKRIKCAGKQRYSRTENFIIRMAAFMLTAAAGVLSGCSEAGAASAAPVVSIVPELIKYEGITYRDFLQQTDQEAELYHASFFIASIPETEIDIIFEGEYDTDLAGAVLTDDSKCVRLEGTLASLLTGIAGEMEPEDFAADIAWKKDTVPEYDVAEGGGTVYYVADRYMVINFDSDGDDTKDAVLEISLNQSEKISPDSYAWLRWETDN